MLPWIIIAVVLVPLLIIAFAAARKTKSAGEHPAPEDAATQARIEQEFADAEAYQEQWREEEKKHQRDTL
jgi:hypothetical protein